MGETLRIRCRLSDLWRDDFGWSENGAWVREAVVTVSATTSDLAINRRIKRALGIQGMRVDDWCSSDFGPWRYGAMGAYADIVESEVKS